MFTIERRIVMANANFARIDTKPFVSKEYVIFNSCCTTDELRDDLEMTDDEDGDGDWGDTDEEESCHHSKSSNATTTDQDNSSNSCSSSNSHFHTRSSDHCDKKSTCEESCDDHKDNCSGGKKKNLCCCCYRKMFPEEENIFSSSSSKKSKSRQALMKERLRLRLSEKKMEEQRAEKEAILKRKIKVLSMDASHFKAKGSVDVKEEELFVPKQKPVDVDELLDFIEGNKNEVNGKNNNSKCQVNDKKKAKKERQKQQKIEEMRKKEEEEKKIKEELEKERQKKEEEKRKQEKLEQQRVEEERKNQEEKERLRVKKINKKAAQKAKKLAEKELFVLSSDPAILDNIDAINKSKVNHQDKGCMTCYDDTLTPTETLEHIKNQHLKDFQQLQTFHRLLIDTVFVPKDIDLENREMDDVEREVEAFKRFCFNSVPVQEKPKVEIDMKKISLKKREIYGDLVVAKKSFSTWCCDM